MKIIIGWCFLKMSALKKIPSAPCWFALCVQFHLRTTTLTLWGDYSLASLHVFWFGFWSSVTQEEMWPHNSTQLWIYHLNATVQQWWRQRQQPRGRKTKLWFFNSWLYFSASECCLVVQCVTEQLTEALLRCRRGNRDATMQKWIPDKPLALSRQHTYCTYIKHASRLTCFDLWHYTETNQNRLFVLIIRHIHFTSWHFKMDKFISFLVSQSKCHSCYYSKRREDFIIKQR